MLLASRPNDFTVKLERYLDDYRKGRARPSDSVPAELREIAAVSSNTLSRTNPRLSSLAATYSSGLSYDRYARFTSGVGEASETYKTLDSLAEQLKAAKKKRALSVRA